MMCQACNEGLHYLCGMQTWCECDCNGADEIWGPSPEDDMPHSSTCACESCVQKYPDRLPAGWYEYETFDDEEE